MKRRREPASEFPKAEETAGKIRAIVFDVDGVLTDGKVYVDSEGRDKNNMNRRKPCGTCL
jgi:3-deoxy-D-manno-octulosonate 8-phosphate phosphatase KdsC-like HAD superfamily phosphatase